MRRTAQRGRAALDAQSGLSAGWLVVVFLLALFAVFSREPSLFTHAQFYAEDGNICYAQAYNLGWLHSLTMTAAGYLIAAERLGTGPALLVPLRWAPLCMMCLGLLFHVLPLPVLLSARCRRYAPLSLRLLFATLIIATPNANEIHVVLTNNMWHLAFAAVLLAFAEPPLSWKGRLVDISIFLLAGFSGPFCILLAPFVLAFWIVRRQPWSLVNIGVMSLGIVTELAMLAQHGRGRVVGPLGASLPLFLRILGGNVFTSTLIGIHGLGYRMPFATIIIAAVGGLALCVYCFRSASLEVKLFFLYCAVLFAAELRSPLIYGPKPPWQLLVTDDAARYWYFPMLVFVFSSLWCAFQARARLFRVSGIAMLCLMPIGIILDWEYKPMRDAHFAESVQAFQQARPGAKVVIPIPPDEWTMTLVKKQ